MHFITQPLEQAPRHADHAAILADLDPELHRLLVGIPAGVLGEEHRRPRFEGWLHPPS
jgi:hypothetical protein